MFENTRELVENLYMARESYHFGKIYRSYVTAPLLALDDMAYMPFAPEKVEYLFRLIHDRTEKKTGSLIITTNSDVKEWSPGVSLSFLISSRFSATVSDLSNAPSSSIPNN